MAGYMPLDAPVFIAGHRGLVGSAIEAELRRQGYTNILTRTRAELNLLDGAAVAAFFEKEKPAFVVLAAGSYQFFKHALASVKASSMPVCVDGFVNRSDQL